ncbi:MAG: quinone-dependent dihydroorotate dehydrogenase [Deltaproteobacteria bacterium]|nr:quinone-dependent dihydroorotate dehydrogenase [Deltaproteobacteria bacterium]
MYELVRPLLFRLEPEQAHHASLRALALLGRSPLAVAAVRRALTPPPAPVRVMGLDFAHPVGLAAGYDKDAVALHGVAALGMSHVEVGTVTLRPQAGNPAPRIFRLPEDRALINRLGFPSAGADVVAARLASKRPAGLVVGVNIGKNKETPLSEAPDEYAALVDRFGPLADYLVINVSSPNTVGLRRLQARDALEKVLGAACARRAALSRRVPLLVKLSPDLDEQALDDALGATLDAGLDGVVVTNTTISREGLRPSPVTAETGGLSGAPLRQRATEMVRAVAGRVGDKLVIIGVGGIMRAEDVRARLDAGASLVQVYTGLIYAGPTFAQRLVRGLAAR